jgi:hypothetical protein
VWASDKRCSKTLASVCLFDPQAFKQCPTFFFPPSVYIIRSQWLRGLRRRSAATRPLRLWVRIPPGVWTFVCCECCVLSGRGLCDGLITRPESYRLWRVFVYDQETSNTRRLKARYWAVKNTTTVGCNARKTNKQYIYCNLSEDIQQLC